MEDLENGNVEYASAGDFLADLKMEFGEGDDESAKMAELKQGERTMEKFVQEFKRAARGSGFVGGALVEKFKRDMNGVIRRKLIEAKWPPRNIEQWYERAVNLDRHWRESRREKEGKMI